MPTLQAQLAGKKQCCHHVAITHWSTIYVPAASGRACQGCTRRAKKCSHASDEQMKARLLSSVSAVATAMARALSGPLVADASASSSSASMAANGSSSCAPLGMYRLAVNSLETKGVTV